ncbi:MULTISPECIES: acyltransferase [Rhodanobacteraceae]|uniref:acyltransferase family protein n=1 Tax=Rhodanobacteraceae TaxID=1775411 RepID=UPI0015922003|nr:MULTISPECIES: acyltransferase [Rhodanobacteraceae]
MFKEEAMTHGQRNNFDALRLFGAFLVLISHQFALSGRAEPRFVGDHSFGNLGVLIFFSISGYLVTSSWLKDPHILRFTARRALRMMPALCVSIPLTLAVIAVLGLTGFPQNPRHLTNGSLWTIPYEVYCYGLLLVAGVATRRPSIVFAVGVFGYFVLSGLQSGESFLADFGLFFAAGSLLRACPYLRKPLPTLSSLVIGYALIRVDQTNLGLAFVVPSLTIAIGVRSWAGLRNISKVGDLSYGIYIYAWPVQQIGVARWGRETPYLELLSITVPVTVALAAASWHLIEKKALRFKPGRPFGNSAPGRARVVSEADLH